MKIEYMTGHYSMEIDGVQFAYKNLQECKDIVHKLVDKCDDSAILQQFVEHFMEHYGKYKDLGKCEQCGDWIENYTIEI